MTLHTSQARCVVSNTTRFTEKAFHQKVIREPIEQPDAPFTHKKPTISPHQTLEKSPEFFLAFPQSSA
jgi:hypothetical protein